MSDEFHRHITNLSDRVQQEAAAMREGMATAESKFGTNNPANSLEAIGGYLGALTEMVGNVGDAVREEFGPGLGEHIQDQFASHGPLAERAAAVTGEIVEGAVEAGTELGIGVGQIPNDALGAAGEIIENSGTALNHLGSSPESPMEGVGEATGGWLNGVIEPLAEFGENFVVDLSGTAANTYGEILEGNLETPYQLIEPLVESVNGMEPSLEPENAIGEIGEISETQCEPEPCNYELSDGTQTYEPAQASSFESYSSDSNTDQSDSSSCSDSSVSDGSSSSYESGA